MGWTHSVTCLRWRSSRPKGRLNSCGLSRGAPNKAGLGGRPNPARQSATAEDEILAERVTHRDRRGAALVQLVAPGAGLGSKILREGRHPSQSGILRVEGQIF